MKQIISAVLISGAIVFASFNISSTGNVIGEKKVFVSPDSRIYTLFFNLETGECFINWMKDGNSNTVNTKRGFEGTALKVLKCKFPEYAYESNPQIAQSQLMKLINDQDGGKEIVVVSEGSYAVVVEKLRVLFLDQ